MPIGDEILGDGILGDGVVDEGASPPTPEYSFPALSTAPLVEAFSEGAALDPTLRSATEAGYTRTRARFTRVPWKYHIEYGDLSQADKDALKAWEISVKVGTDSFTHPNIGMESVRLAGPIKYNYAEAVDCWTAAMDVREKGEG
jgi:hypothetical protein